MDGEAPLSDERVLIVAPTGHDAENTVQVLRKEGILGVVCPDIPDLCRRAPEGVGAVLLTQESLTATGINCLTLLLKGQQPWSDLPVVLLASSADTTAPGMASVRVLSTASTLTVLERPLRVVTLVTAVKTALRARRRQYQIRELLVQRENITSQLRERAQRLEESQGELLAAKEKISRHAEDLEQTVAERTAWLQETVAQLEAFSYSISHDMRGPLRAMQQYSQIILQDYGPRLPVEAAGYLDRIARAANRLDRLIQDVLTYSKVAREAMPLGPVDLDKLVHEIIQQYPGFQPPEAEIRVLEPLPRVLGHEAALTQCISNLLANAVKFVPAGTGPRIRVWTGSQNGSVRIWFEDNGIGIAPENHCRIFNIFERVHSDSEFEGTGIGLSIVKKAIERMGGDVGVESEPGRGSRFWIALPNTRV